jgi:hypothetical protein
MALVAGYHSGTLVATRSGALASRFDDRYEVIGNEAGESA